MVFLGVQDGSQRNCNLYYNFHNGIMIAHQLNVVSSGSMEPVLYKGDIVLIDYNPSSIEVGDIIVYKAAWYENKSVIHRVVAKQTSDEGNFYTIKGDNNHVQDPYPISRK
ncbi:MAG: signal peptidase I [Methanobacterium sp.]|nr:signal peptidase I [Methanobacterium sp.]